MKRKNAMPTLALSLAALLTGCQNLDVDNLPVTPVPPGRAAAVCVGLTRVNPDAYGGWDGDCPGCDADCLGLAADCRGLGYASVVVLRNEDATIQRFLAQCLAAAASLKPAADAGLRPVLFVYFSGHGGQTADLNGDEADRKDETLCLWNGQLLDDLLYALLCKIQAGIRVVFFSDSCNSGSVYKRAFAERFSVYARARATRENTLKCEFMMLAGCADGKSSLGFDDGGAWTTAWRKSWRGRTWKQAFDAAASVMPRRQVPVFTYVGDCGAGVSPALPDMEAMK